jgi:hypothetical protein
MSEKEFGLFREMVDYLLALKGGDLPVEFGGTITSPDGFGDFWVKAKGKKKGINFDALSSEAVAQLLRSVTQEAKK